MANGNKIDKDLIEQTKAKFLPEEIVDEEKKISLYSLDKEFSKTRKNKNITLWFTILAFIGIIFAGTYFLTMYLEEQDKKIEVNISDFDDLRLKDVLDSARKKSDNADIVAIQLDILEIAMLDEILSSRNRHYRRELEIISRDLSDNETDSNLSRIRGEEKKDVRRIRRKYKGLIWNKRRELNALLKKKKEEQARIEKENALSNEDRLYAMRTKNLKNQQKKGTRLLKGYLRRYSRYVKHKYDPVFRSGKINGIIKSSSNKSQREDPAFYENYNKLLSSKRPLSQKSFRELQKRIKNYDMIIKRLRRVPYDNSMDPSLDQVDYLTKSIIYDYERQIRQRDRELSNFRYAMNYILNLRPENGYIIDARNLELIKFHMFRALRVADGETAMVFRNEDEYIGKIQFVKKPYGMRARVIATEGGKKVQPFDKILLELKEMKKETP
jgi:hypothetical protein